jgi:hypothetical protein
MEDLDNSQWTPERESQSLAADDAAYPVSLFLGYIPDCIKELVRMDQAAEDIPLDEDLPTTEIQTQDF